MSRLTEIPEVVVKPGKMISYWSTKMKVFVFLLALALYASCLILIKTLYLKNQKYNHIMAMMEETAKIANRVQALDQNLAMKIKQIKEYYNEH